jgi:hypothetical protein
MDDSMMKDASKIGSNELIAHAMAARVLDQVQNKKSKTVMAKDLSRTKGALALAQKAIFDKDPRAINLLQLKNKDLDKSTIFLQESEEQTRSPDANSLLLSATE